MDKYEIIIKALELYRERKLQDDVTDMTLAEYSDGAWDRQDIYNVCKTYANIDRIIKSLQETKDVIHKYSSSRMIDETTGEVTPVEYNELVSRYNTLYFNLIDICG